MINGETEFPRIGTVTRAKIIKVTKDSFKLKLLPQKCQAILPFEHLSDYPEITELWKLALSRGDFVQKVTPFNKKDTVSMKECLVSAAEQKLCVQSFNDLKAGMLLPGVVKNHQDFGFFVELAGGHTGLCPATSLPSVEKSALKKHYPEGRSVLAYVKKIGDVKGRFLVSLASQDCKADQAKSLTEYLQSRNDVLKSLAMKTGKWKSYCDVAVGSIVEVTVTSVKKKKVQCDTLSGLQAFATDDHLGDVKPETGKQYTAVVLDVDVLSPSLQISFDPKLCKAVKSLGQNCSSELKIGQTLKGELLLKKQQFLLMKLKERGCNKFLYAPATQHFNAIKEASKHDIGTCSEVVIKGKVDGNLIGVLDKESDGDVHVGDVVEAVVKKICPLEMQVVVNDVQGRIHISEVSDIIEEGKNPLQNFKKDMRVKVKVIAKKMTTEKSDSATPFLECSLKLSKMDKTNPEELLRQELMTSRGAKMVVFIKNVDSFKISVQASLMHTGSVSMFNVSEDITLLNGASSHFKVGQALVATVIGKTHEDRILFSLIGKEEAVPAVGMQVTALITGVDKSKSLSLKLSNGLKGVAEIPKAPASNYSKGKYVRCDVLSVSKDGVYNLGLSRKRKASVIPEDVEKAKKMKKVQKRERPSSSSESESEEEMAPVAKKSKANGVNDSNTKADKPNKTRSGKERLTISGFGWGGKLNVQQEKKDGSDDDDDDDVDNKTKPAKTDGKSRRKEMRQEEKKIDEYEKQQLKGNTGPHNVNDYERLVLQSPNSSMVWLGYMAYHLELGEVAKARTVAEKALDTISFREEQEKKNVWLAYLNLEVMYGESEDLKKLLQRAITYNDPFDIQLKMCDIYIGASKMEDAELQFQVMVRKFKKDKSVWKSYAQFLYTQNKQAAARNILKKCLITLEKRDHVEVITRFACLEFSHGNAERGRTLFENLIASYPQRTDIWSVYVDIVVKSGDITGARNLLERAVQQKLNAKKVSFLIKKYIRFEETHGTEDHVNKVKDMAVSLFQSEK